MRLRPSVTDSLDDFRAWSRSGATKGPISLVDYVGFVATPDLFFAFAELYSPETVVRDGRKYLACRFSDAAYVAWQRKGIPPSEIQRVMNHLHVTTLIQRQMSDEVALEAARVLGSIWQRTLENVTVAVVGTSVADAAVTFHE